MNTKNINNFWIDKIKLSDFSLNSRIFFAPINTGLSNNNSPLNELISFHTDRSGHGIGISYVGNVAISQEYLSNKNTIVFKDEDRKIWEEMTESIKKNGTLAGVQLGCKLSKIEGLKEFTNKDPINYIEYSKNEINSLSINQIKEIINKFLYSILFAINVGFEVVQIHSGHGYFLSQMISDSFNIREDEYGKDKVIILRQIVNKVRSFNRQIILDVRISVIEGIKKREDELESKIKLLKELSNLDIDIISISHGIYNVNKRLIYPSKTDLPILNIDEIISLCLINDNKLWNFAGFTWNMDTILNLNLPKNISFSIGRGIIADSLYVDKLLDGKNPSIIGCSDCQKCHYYSNGYDQIICNNWI